MKNLKLLLFIICLVFFLIALLPHFILSKIKKETTFAENKGTVLCLTIPDYLWQSKLL